jgi:hypothetical protein
VRINSRKSWKILGRICQHINAVLKPFALMKHQDASTWMQHTLNQFIYFIKSNKDFSYIISPVKKNKCWINFKIMRKSLFKYSLYSHPEIGNFRVWHVPFVEPLRSPPHRVISRQPTSAVNSCPWNFFERTKHPISIKISIFCYSWDVMCDRGCDDADSEMLL